LGAVAPKTKQREGKVFSLHANTEDSRGIVPVILNLGIKWMWAIFIPNPASLRRGKKLFTRWVGLRAGLDEFGEHKISCLCQDSNPGPSNP